MSTDGTLLEVLDDADGREVEVYERNYAPLAWWFKWSLDTGVIVTHLRGGDGWDLVVDMPNHISIDEGGSTPMLLLSKPLFAVPSTRVGYQELALFMDYDSINWVKAVRPGFLSAGSIATKSLSTGATLVRGGFPGGELQTQVMDGQAAAVDNMRSMLDEMEIL